MTIKTASELLHCKCCDAAIQEGKQYVDANGTAYCSSCIYEMKKDEVKTFNRQEENVQLLNKLLDLVSKPEYKDIRLGQLLSNALGDKDLFFIESSELEKLLQFQSLRLER